MANPVSADNTHLTNYLNNLGYENYIWKTKYNELWTNFLSVMEENKRLQAELNECTSKLQNQNQMQSIQQMLENDSAAGNRNPLVEYLQKKNAELITIIMQKDAIIASFQKNIPNAPPPLHPPIPPTPPIR
jgi:predicted  nucleic acid-binding Zn-ribbon protein